MSALSAFLLALAAFALFAASIHRHSRDAALPAWATRHKGRFRPAGGLLLAASFAAQVHGAGWRMAVVEWVGLIGAAAALIVLILYIRPRALPLILLAAPMGVVLFLLRG